jgi:ribosomal protein S18 acetylase RimI-like enzyme
VDRYFTADYVERATLRDGTPVMLRLVCPDDKELLRREFDRWSQDSRYSRFHAAKTKLTDEELDYLTNVDQESHFALGALGEAGDGQGEPVGLGVARFIRLPDELGAPNTAEAAISVADSAQHQGLGRLLFLRLVAAAAERGIERFRCEVLGSNASMANLIGAIAPEHTTEVESGVMRIDFALPVVLPDVPPSQPPEGAMYRLFRAVAQGAVQLARRLRE